MSKVYKFRTIILMGFVAGIVATIKWIAPPGEDIEIGKIKVKGRGNNQSATVEVVKKSKRDERKQRRLSKKNNSG